MAKAGKPRHSDSTRTPPIIDHEPLNEKDDKEPEAVDKNDKAKNNKAENTAQINQALPKPQDDETKKQDDSAHKMTMDEKPQDKQLLSNTVTNKATDSRANEKPIKAKGSSSLLGGVAGGIIALVIAGGLQWAGILPVPTQNTQNIDNNQITALQQQIDALKTDVSAQRTAPNTDETAIQDAINKANDAAQTANNALSQSDDNAQALNALKTTINSLGAQNGDTSALTALSTQITNLEDKASLTDELNKRVAENQGALDQVRTRLTTLETAVANVKNMGERLTNLEANEKAQSTALASLQESAKSFEERILSASSTDQTRLIAANSLKDAVNRGGSYINELQTFEKVAPDGYSLDLLKTYANTGLPTGAELSKQFTKVADNIAATQYAAAENAGIGDKLWSSARQLVVTRPVGNVEGSTPGDIAARMEVAIEKGDYESAIAQWQTLPDNAKAVSTDFMKVLKARNDADSLINRLITDATQSNIQPVNGRKM